MRMTRHRIISSIFPNPLLPSSRLQRWISNGVLTDPLKHHSRHLFSTQSPQPSNPKSTPQPNKYYIYHGQRTQSIKTPTMKGCIFTNTRSKPWTHLLPRKPELKPFRTDLWDPQTFDPKLNRNTLTANEINFKTGRGLSAIARYVCESFSKHKKWGPEILEDLKKLHRVTPNVVTEVLKVMIDANLAAKFFHWAHRQKGFRHNFSAYNAFAYCLNRAGKYKAADQVVELMYAHGKQPSMKQFEIMIRMHADAGRGLRVYFVFQKMKKFEVKPSIFLYNRILDALVRTEHLDLALLVYEEFRKDGLEPESITFMILIKGLCKEGKMDRVFEFLDEMRSKCCRPDVFAYTAMIRSLVGVGNLEGAWRIWNEMARACVKPDAMSYTTLITGLCKGNEDEKALILFREMKARGFLIDRTVYGSLIAMYASNKRVGFAYNLLKEMVKCGYKADLGIYESLIEAFCNEKRVDKAYKLLQILIQEGVSHNYSTFMPLFWAFAETNNIDDVSKLLEQMTQLGRPVKEDVIKFFVFMVCKEEKVMKAVGLFEELKERGYYSVSIFNVLIDGLYKAGDIVKALALFEEMEGVKCEPDVFTYNYVIPCLVDSGKLQEACNLFGHMKERSWVPIVTVYTALVSSLCKVGEIEAALLLVRDCLGSVTNGPRVFKYTLTILHACHSGKAEPVLEVFTEMMQECVPLEDVIYCAVISGLCRHGNVEEARKVFRSLRNGKHITESLAAEYDVLLIDHLEKTTSELLRFSLKFHGLESLLITKNTDGT